MKLKNRSFQYGKVVLEVRTQKTSVTVCAQSGRRLHVHTRVVEHATVKLLGQWCSGRSNATPRWDAVSSGRRRESCYGRRVAGAHHTPHSPRDLGRGYWVSTATVRWNLVYCETKTPRCHRARWAGALSCWKVKKSPQSVFSILKTSVFEFHF